MLGVLNKVGSIPRGIESVEDYKFARCVKQGGFYTNVHVAFEFLLFARCVKQGGFYTRARLLSPQITFARCVKQGGFYTILLSFI